MLVKKRSGLVANLYTGGLDQRYGYQHAAYTGMKLIFVSESSNKVADMEKTLIGIYRWKDRSGKMGATLILMRAPKGRPQAMYSDATGPRPPRHGARPCIATFCHIGCSETPKGALPQLWASHSHGFLWLSGGSGGS